MKKIIDSKNTLTIAENLIVKMEKEIEKLRYIIYRYNLKYGETIPIDKIEVSNKLDFHISIENDILFCKIIDSNNLKLNTNYFDILDLLKELK